jgi:hypothetical protein
MSAVVPGTGQLYAGSNRGYIFLGIEAVAMMAFIKYNNDSHDKRDTYYGYVGDPTQNNSRFSFTRLEGNISPQEIARLEEVYAKDPREFYDEVTTNDALAAGWSDQGIETGQRSQAATYMDEVNNLDRKSNFGLATLIAKPSRRHGRRPSPRAHQQHRAQGPPDAQDQGAPLRPQPVVRPHPDPEVLMILRPTAVLLFASSIALGSAPFAGASVLDLPPAPPASERLAQAADLPAPAAQPSMHEPRAYDGPGPAGRRCARSSSPAGASSRRSTTRRRRCSAASRSRPGRRTSRSSGRGACAATRTSRPRSSTRASTWASRTRATGSWSASIARATSTTSTS